ncbi:alpha/beta hydrolase family protein [Rheinheimera hassiensis]|uniref:alpha/beta hydrolase family protein n=1 Tax=Rheinheimera hassiensis TaxID=1193627 RepID=UPI001F070737|nr:S9 family peptidase [Rheinheimera hassiensis]
MKLYFLLAAMILCSTMVNADQERIISDFSQNPQFSNMKISPNGEYLAVETYIKGIKVLAFIKRQSLEMVNAVRFGSSGELSNYYWVNNERVVIQLAQSEPWAKEPQYTGELYAINIDGKKAELIYGYRAGKQQVGSNIKKRESIYGWADIIDLLPDDERQILIASTSWSLKGDRHADVLLLDAYTGKSRKVSYAPGPYTRFLTNQQGELALAVSLNKDNRQDVFTFDKENNDWVKVPPQTFGRSFYPVALNDDASAVYVLDDYQQDKQGLFEFSLSDFKYKAIFSDEKVDISTLQVTKKQQIFGVKLDDGLPTYALLTDKYTEAQIFKELLAVFAGEAIEITSKSLDDRFWVVYSYSDKTPGSYFLFDKKEGSLAKIADVMPNLNSYSMVAMAPIQYESFDSKKIHGYFTESELVSEHKPLVVYVHGGPHGVRDRWGFDPEVQLLAKAGYSVLQVNYRGSGGYGTVHLEAGYLQWGDAIQRDIIAGTEWAIASGKAKKGNICIVGASFGGYSALQSATIAPDLYKCIVGVAGVYDLSLMRTEGDIPLRDFGISFLNEVIGTDAKILSQYSPVNNVAKLTAPVLIAHGKNDKRAPLEHADVLKKAMDSAGKKYQWLLFNDETHGFYSPENREIYYKELLAFLNKHLAH